MVRSSRFLLTKTSGTSPRSRPRAADPAVCRESSRRPRLGASAIVGQRAALRPDWRRIASTIAGRSRGGCRAAVGQQILDVAQAERGADAEHDREADVPVDSVGIAGSMHLGVALTPSPAVRQVRHGPMRRKPASNSA